MPNEQFTSADFPALVHLVQDAQRPACRRRRAVESELVVDPWSYPAKRGRGTIRLAPIEYRILKLLASRPNQVFTPRRIAEAVSSASQSVTPETLYRYVTSLRSQLGFFSDYIQTVPYMGYRFKA
jgi:Response regulators consisting of a CheY-like receiver domain and a winged-helix DNA-binding domain